MTASGSPSRPVFLLSDFYASSSAPIFAPTRYLQPYIPPSTNPAPDSDLLKSIRAALRGSHTSPHEVHSVFYDWPRPGTGSSTLRREVSWNRNTVVLSSGGVICRQWSFAHEQQPVQCVCVGHLEQTGIIVSSRSSGNYTSEFHAGPSKSSPDDSSNRPTFGPFARAEQERKRAIEPETRSRAVFVFLRSMGKIYLENGVEYAFALPFIVRKAWPLFPHGVVMQRVLDASEVKEAEEEGDEPLPTLFSMTSPLAEATVVGMASTIIGGFKGIPPVLEEESEGSFVPPKEMIVDVTGRTAGDDVDILVSVDADKRTLSIWRYIYVKQKDLPSAKGPSRSRKKRASTAMPGRQRTSLGANESFTYPAPPPLANATTVDDHPLEKSPATSDTQLAPLSALPGMAPSLTTITAMANLVAPPADSKPLSLPSSPAPKATRRNSLGQKDPNSTAERMSALARAEAVEAALGATDHTRMRSTHWVTKLYSVDISEADATAWRQISVSVFDQRWDGKDHRALIGICLPASKTLSVFSYLRCEDKTMRILPITQRPALSSVPLRFSRDNIYDLLVANPEGDLTVLTHGLREWRIANNAISPADPTNPDAPGGGKRIASLSDANGSSVRITFADKTAMVTTFDCAPQDILTSQCLQVLAVTLPGEAAHDLHLLFTMKWVRRRRDCSEGVEFACFSEALGELFSLDLVWNDKPPTLASIVASTSTSSITSTTSSTPSTPWSRLATISTTSSFSRYTDDPLLSSGFSLPPTPTHRPQHISSSRRPHPLLSPVLNSLHMLGEDLRLVVSRHAELVRLARLICSVARVIRPEWVDYWKRLVPAAMQGWVSPANIPKFVDDRLPVWPPDMTTLFYGRLAQPDWGLPWYDTNRLSAQFKITPSYPYGRLDPLTFLRQFTAIHKSLADKASETTTIQRATNALQLLVSVNENFNFGGSSSSGAGAGAGMGGSTSLESGSDFLGSLPLGLAGPMREIARTCQLHPGQDWHGAAYSFVGRNDLAEGLAMGGKVRAEEEKRSAGYKPVKDYLASKPRRTIRSLIDQANALAVSELDTKLGVEVALDDFTKIRFGQDKRLEEVARMLRSSTVASIKLPDRPELNDQDQVKEQQNQVLRIAERTLALPLGRAMFTFGSVATVTREAYSIPKMEFGVRLFPQNLAVTPEPYKIPVESLNWGDFHNGVAAALRISPTSEVIDSSWIKFNKPSELTPEHAGFLYGLGLTGHLKEMLTWHTFSYLTPKHDLTSIGVLLGLAAANVGTGNRHVTKLLAVHTPALLPTPSIDLNVPLITQTAGLVGIGLLFMGTKHRRMAEVCLRQIGRGDLTQPDLSNEHREAYTMAAALAFGMVMLGKGSANMIPADEALVTELRILVHGEAPSHQGSKRTRAAFDINLTSPAAAIALGLMYLKTESQEVADVLTIPDTILALNKIPPGFLLLRVLARALIMWDTIKPTHAWVDAQIPPSIAYIMKSRATAKVIDEAVELAYYNLVAGSCFAIALKYAGTAREEPYSLLIMYHDMFSRLAYTNGAAFDHRIKRHAIRDGLNLISISLNMVMAGTGEINCLRRLRYAYGMYNQAMRYGTHMATHMSLGLLFLGGGRFTLGNSDAAVVCMIAAFFPRFAPISADNKSYLQALRHLWVLAVEPRCLIARDVDTKEIVYLPVKIRVKEGTETSISQLISPTLIPDFDKLQSIRVDTPRYWPFYLDFHHMPRHRDTLLQNQTIFVKRRTAFLSYLEDPKGSRSLFVRSGSSTGDAATLDFPRLTDTKPHPASDLTQFISSFSNNPFFLAFADHFCRDSPDDTAAEKLFYNFCHASLLDCILQDKPQTLQSYIMLYRYRTMPSSSRYFHLRLQDLRFAVDFYTKVFDRRFSGRAENNPRAPLIRDSTLSGVLYALDQQLDTIRNDDAFLETLGNYARGELMPALASASPQALNMSQKLAWYLLRNNVPVSALLTVLQGLAQHAHAHCLSLPPPDGTDDSEALAMGIREVLHTTGTQMTTTLGSGWSMRSLDEIMTAWKAR